MVALNAWKSDKFSLASLQRMSTGYDGAADKESKCRDTLPLMS